MWRNLDLLLTQENQNCNCRFALFVYICQRLHLKTGSYRAPHLSSSLIAVSECCQCLLWEGLLWVAVLYVNCIQWYKPFFSITGLPSKQARCLTCQESDKRDCGAWFYNQGDSIQDGRCRRAAVAASKMVPVFWWSHLYSVPRLLECFWPSAHGRQDDESSCGVLQHLWDNCQ